MAAHPVLLVKLSEPSQPTYNTGDRVTGVVVQDGVSNNHGSISITFAGRSKTEIVVRSHVNSKSVFHGRATLFRYISHLHEEQDETSADAKQKEWPFEFVVPEFVQPSDCLSDGDRWVPEKPFRGAFDPQKGGFMQHLLPPTFHYGSRGPSLDVTAAIEYVLIAKSSQNVGDENTLAIKYMPPVRQYPLGTKSALDPVLNQKLEAREKKFEVSSLRLFPDHTNRRLSFGEKARSWFQSSRLPRSEFLVSVQYPAHYSPGSPIPFVIELHHSLEHSTAPKSPTVTLRRFALVAVARTSVRTSGSPGLAGSSHSEDCDERVKLAARSGMDLPLSERTDLGRLLDLRVKPGQLIPDFSTYNIAHSHHMECAIIAECAGVKCEMEWKYPMQVISPSAEEPPNEEAGDGT